MKYEQYVTKDLGECAALLTCGMKLRSLQWKDKIAYFVFSEMSPCESYARDYHAGKMTVNPRIFYDNLRTVKGKLYENEKRNYEKRRAA